MNERAQNICLLPLLTLAAAALFAGCVGKATGNRAGHRAERRVMTSRSSDVVLMPLATGGGEPAAMIATRHESATDMDRGGSHAEHASVPAGEFPTNVTVDAMLEALGGGADRTFPVQMPAQGGEAPMTSMQTGSAGSQAASMTDMMGAPGLVPFDVMTGQAGRWMVGYQFMAEKSDGSLIGPREISESKILDRFFAAPTDMTMQMHMAMLMYAPTDKLTLMLTVPYIRKHMNHVTVGGMRFAERTEGLGDIDLRGMYAVHESEDLRHRLLLIGGIGMPTGSINAKMDGMRLEYPMQIGSGTYSLLPGLTYLGQASPWGWAADIHATLRLGRNDNGYRLGDRFESSIAIARELRQGVSLSTGVRGEWWGNIHGVDPLLDPSDEPTKDPNLQGGRRLSAVLGIAVHPENGLLLGQHFHLQLEAPIVESLDGPQLKRRWILRIGWQLEF